MSFFYKVKGISWKSLMEGFIWLMGRRVGVREFIFKMVLFGVLDIMVEDGFSWNCKL